jgi:hypothetical protein
MFRHNCPLAVKPASTPGCLVHKKTWRDSLPIDMLVTAVSVLVVAQPSLEVPEGLMKYPVIKFKMLLKIRLNTQNTQWRSTTLSSNIFQKIYTHIYT